MNDSRPTLSAPPAAADIAATGCLFEQPWWLEAVAPGRWSAVEIRGDDTTLARFPYVVTHRRGLTLVRNPPLTPTLGPWITPSTAKYSRQLAHQKRLLTQLLEQLPETDLFQATCHPVLQYVMPFHWAQFEMSVGFTYRLDDVSDPERIWAGMRDNIRREIRKARRKVEVDPDCSLEEFRTIQSLTYDRQQLPNPVSFELLQRLDTALAARGQRQILAARDASGRIHAAVYLVWDHRTAYYLLGGGDPEFRNSGAHSLLMFQAIESAGRVSGGFDFEGSMVEPIEQFFRAFGARQVPVYRIRRCSRRYRALSAIRELAACLRPQRKAAGSAARRAAGSAPTSRPGRSDSPRRAA